MDKLRMQTMNKADENFKKLTEMFPNAVTETIDENGEVVRAIDKDVLMQEINTKVIDGKEERYQFTWPDKKKSVLLANAPISKTLRPCREESVDFDTTKNLYIEGDNLEVLKLLQETYLGKIKMIYIDPPYNTGNDFVYEDDFAQNADELELPHKLDAYDTLTVCVLFHNFPAIIKQRCKGTIVLTTAIGNIKKKVELVEYNKDYQEADYRDYLCYCRSLEEIKQ